MPRQCRNCGATERIDLDGLCPNCSTTKPAVTFKDAQQAFSEAIEAGRLSAAEGATNYAGHFMYMGTWSGRDSFKHIDTREYIA